MLDLKMTFLQLTKLVTASHANHILVHICIILLEMKKY